MVQSLAGVFAEARTGRMVTVWIISDSYAAQHTKPLRGRLPVVQ